jgi:putative endonuclease
VPEWSIGTVCHRRWSPPFAGSRQRRDGMIHKTVTTMYYTYIIQSVRTKRYYIGSTQNIDNRLKRHNKGFTKSIKYNGPFILIYKEEYPTKAEAYKREKQIKKYKSGAAFKKLIH